MINWFYDFMINWSYNWSTGTPESDEEELTAGSMSVPTNKREVGIMGIGCVNVWI